MNGWDILLNMDWVSPIIGIIQQASGKTIALGVPTEEWPETERLLKEHRIRTYAIVYRSDVVAFNVARGIAHLTWNTLTRAGLTMLGPCPPSPRTVGERKPRWA